MQLSSRDVPHPTVNSQCFPVSGQLGAVRTNESAPKD